MVCSCVREWAKKMLQQVRVFVATIGLSMTVLFGGCGGTTSDQASSGASTDEIKAFVDANPSYAEKPVGAGEADAKAGTQSASPSTSQPSQPLDLGN
jgi:hypothetical protein